MDGWRARTGNGESISPIGEACGEDRHHTNYESDVIAQFGQQLLSTEPILSPFFPITHV